MLVTLAGTIPDADGLGLLWDLAFGHPDRPLALWSAYHHVLAHNLAFGLVIAVIAFLIASRRTAVCAVALSVFHLHLLCDILGSRGPDQAWSVPYLLPFSRAWDFVWPGQWPLSSWQNFAITAATLVFIIYQAWMRGISPIELVSKRANDLFVTALRARFGEPAESVNRTV
jgi:hypothetical protein